MKLFRRIKTALTMDAQGWQWAYRFFAKRAKYSYRYLRTRLLGRRFWQVDVDGITVRLYFSSLYHHEIAKDMHENRFERSVLEAWVEASKKASTIYDIGGFNGLYGLFAAKANPQASITIFEPDPINVAHIKKNIRENGLNNCRVLAVAITDHDGEVSFSSSGTTGGRIGRGANKVRVQPLSDFPPAKLLKIDVEGVEDTVILPSLDLFKEKPTLFLEVHKWCQRKDELWSALHGLGYRERVLDTEDAATRYILK